MNLTSEGICHMSITSSEYLAANVSYQYGFSHNTDLLDRCADIVTCSQSLHWMEPESTFAEVNRILRSGGIFAAYQFDKIPTMNWEVEMAYNCFLERCKHFEK